MGPLSQQIQALQGPDGVLLRFVLHPPPTPSSASQCLAKEMSSPNLPELLL